MLYLFCVEQTRQRKHCWLSVIAPRSYSRRLFSHKWHSFPSMSTIILWDVYWQIYTHILYIYTHAILWDFFFLSMRLDSKWDFRQIKMRSCGSSYPKRLVRIRCQSLPTDWEEAKRWVPHRRGHCLKQSTQQQQTTMFSSRKKKCWEWMALDRIHQPLE